MPIYADVIKAASDTVRTVLVASGRVAKDIDDWRNRTDTFLLVLDTNGGQTAGVMLDKGGHGSGTITLSMPSLGGDVYLSRAEGDYMTGLILHECCHVLHTDFGVWRHRDVQDNDQLRMVLNWLEDARIERQEIAARRMAGACDLLAHMNTTNYLRSLAESTKLGIVIGSGGDAQDVAGITAHVVRRDAGQDLPDGAKLLAALPAAARAIVDYAAPELKVCTNTADALALAREVLRRLGQAASNQQQQPQQGKGRPQPGEGHGEPDEADESGEKQEGEGQGEGQGEEEGEGEGQGAGEGQGKAEKPGQGEGKGRGRGADTGEAKAKPGKAGRGAGGGSVMDPTQTTRGVLGDIMKREGCRTDQSWQGPILTFDGGKVVVSRRREPGIGNKLKKFMQAPARLRDQIARLIKSDERHGTERYRSSGRLDRRALTRASMDAMNVFSKRTMVEGVDTAILFLIDGSGSMGNSADHVAGTIYTRLEVAQVLAYHLADAADAARGQTCIATFRGGYGQVALHVSKGFGDATDINRIAGVGEAGATPLSTGIMAARDMLLGQAASRRILLALTDGDDDFGARAVRLAVALCEKAGVEVVGLGCAQDVSKVFPNSVSVGNAGELATRGLEALATVLGANDD